MAAPLIRVVALSAADLVNWIAELRCSGQLPDPDDARPALLAQAELMLARLRAGEPVSPGVALAWFEQLECWRESHE